MPPNISFSLTTPQIRARTKTVTRRLGWWKLKPGQILTACVKCMGLKRGDKIERITQIRVLNSRPEPLNSITPADVILEGFPEWTTEQFIAMFTAHNHCPPDQIVNRIEFEYIPSLPHPSLHDHSHPAQSQYTPE